jgi:hypothetical protein
MSFVLSYSVFHAIRLSLPVVSLLINYTIYLFYFLHREAVRQRKALSRTSSNILLNSVQPYNYQPINNRLKLQAPRFSDCDEHNLTIKESQQESHSEISELEVSTKNMYRNYTTPHFDQLWFACLSCVYMMWSDYSYDDVNATKKHAKFISNRPETKSLRLICSFKWFLEYLLKNKLSDFYMWILFTGWYKCRICSV